MRWVHRGLSLIFVLLCSFPVMLVVSNFTDRAIAAVCLTALPGFIAASTLNIFFKKHYRLIGLFVLILLNAGIGVLLFGGLVSILEPVLMCIAQIITLGFSVNFDKDPVTFREFGIGATLYGIAYALCYVDLALEVLPVLSIFCVIYMAYSIVLMNYNAVSDAGYLSRRVNKGGLSSSLRSGNIVLTLIFLAVALILVNIGTIKDAFLYAVSQVVLFIFWLMSFAGGEQSSGGGGGGGDMLSEFMDDEAKTMAPWLEALLNVVMYVIVVAALLALAAFIGYAIFKGVKKFIALVRKWLGMQAELHEGGVGYTDERSKLQRNQIEQEEKEPRAGLIKRLMHRLPKWGELDDRARIRFALQMIMYPARQSTPDRTRTASEIIEKAYLSKDAEKQKQAFAIAYDRARYSTAEVSAEDAERARRMLEGR